MKEENKKAWNLLTKDEEAALNLSIKMGKSTWEAGEILQKAHYKYLEIKARAEHFFKVFSNYFEKYEELIEPEIREHLHIDFVHFIESTMLERKSIKETIEGNFQSLLLIETSRNRLIEQQMNLLKEMESETADDLILIIHEFDRCNNFRILPRHMQEPSFFKRRNKSRDLKHLKLITSLPPFILDILKINYEYKGQDAMYLPLLDTRQKRGFQIIKVDPQKMGALSRLSFFVFKEEDKALALIKLTKDYIESKSKTCKTGQKFWPQYRVLIKDSINWKEANNIIPQRSMMIDAFNDLDLLKVKKIEHKKRIEAGEKVTREEKFWLK